VIAFSQVVAFTHPRKRPDEVEVTNKSEKVMAPSNSNSTSGENRCKKASHDTGPMLRGCTPLDSFSGDQNIELVERLFDMAQSILTERQKFLLVSAVTELRWNSMTLTALCERLARELGMSYSTVKWNVKRLTVMRLLSGGTENTKGTRAQLTPLGHLIVSMLSQNGNNAADNGAKEAKPVSKVTEEFLALYATTKSPAMRQEKSIVP
jgi:hypothetical protein